MADNTIQLKRSSVAGKTPNTSTLATGELAINLTDKKLYSSDGSNIFEPAGNVTDINITGGIKANGSFGTNGYVLSTNGSGIYWTASTGGSVINTAPSNIRNIVNTSINTTASVIDTANATGISTIEYLISARDNINFNYKSARILITTDGTNAFITEYGIVLSNNSAQVCSFDSDINTGNIRLLATGDSVDVDVSLQRVVLGSSTEAGDIAASIILDSVTNTSIIVSASANSVKNAYDRAIDANTRAASAQTEATAAYTNAVIFAANATNINTGTLSYAQIPANVINTTADFTRTGITTFSANIVLGSSGVSSNGSFGTNGQVLSSNGTATYWATAGGLTVRSTNGSNGVVNTSVANVTGINFDESTGLHVTDQGSGNVFVSLGSGYKFITVSGQTTITAVGEDTLNIANGDNIYLTTSNTIVKTLTIGANLQSFIQNTDSRTLSGNLNFTGANTRFDGKVTLAGNAVINAGISIIDSTGSQGTSGQVLASNGSGNVYWATVANSGFTNGQSISVNNFVVTGSITANGSNGVAGYVLHSNGSSAYWEIASNAAAAYSNAVSYIDIAIGTSNTAITSNAATAYTNATIFAANISNVNSGTLSEARLPYRMNQNVQTTDNVTFNDLTVTGNLTLTGNTLIVGANNLVVSDAIISLHTPANLAALTSNDGRNIGLAFHYYDTEDKHALLYRDNTTGYLQYHIDGGDPISNSNPTGNNFGTIQTAIFWAGNSSVYATVNATNYTGTSNNASYLNGQLSAYYTNATNITTGTLPYTQIPVNVINTTADFTRTGITTFSANVVLGTSGISSNGSFGTSGQVLTTNGSSTYWSTSAGGGGGISSLSFVGFYSGYNNPTTGTLRRYFANNITVTKMTAWVGITSGSNLKLTLKKNGSEIANTIVTAGASKANVTFSSNVISDVDYLTLDLTSGSGTDIGVRIDYTPYA